MKIDREKKISGKKERKKIFCILTDVNTTFRRSLFRPFQVYICERKKRKLFIQ